LETTELKADITPIGFEREVMATGNVRMTRRGNGYECVAWMRLVQDRNQWRTVVNVVMNL